MSRDPAVEQSAGYPFSGSIASHFASANKQILIQYSWRNSIERRALTKSFTQFSLKNWT